MKTITEIRIENHLKKRVSIEDAKKFYEWATQPILSKVIEGYKSSKDSVNPYLNEKPEFKNHELSMNAYSWNHGHFMRSGK